MKHCILRIAVVVSLIVPLFADAQEKSISLDKALEIVQGYYENDLEANQNYYWLKERTEQWEIFVDEEPIAANWAHDCKIYKFPNTGNLAVDTVPEITQPWPRIPPNEEMELLSECVYAYRFSPGSIAKSSWTKFHSLIIYEGKLNEDDFQKIREYIYEGNLVTIKLYNLELDNNAIPDKAFWKGEYEDSNSSKGLRRILLRGDIEVIGEMSFNGCDFEYITLPASVQSLGLASCYNWDRIKWIYSMPETPPVCEDGDAFGGLTPKSTPIYVPVGSAEAYRAAPGWDYFTTFIETEEAPYAGIGSAETRGVGSSKAYWANGSLILESDEQRPIYAVYGADGKRIVAGVMSSTRLLVSLPQGIYIVKLGNDVHKIY